ncbi:MAG: ABC transporter substrate-binding protein [Alphaproteobacteria bacterium]|nr:ABC transporter substrate-binding protein [Alphaproteobacteria bacterium]
MTRMTRRAALGAIAGTALAGALTGLARAQAKTVKVAMIAPLSGPWARQGELMRKGCELAIEDINAAGGVKALGGTKMELVIADAGDSTEKAKNAAQRLVAQEPDLIGGTGAWLSSFTLAVTEVTERAELPMLTLSYSDVITDRGFKYIFQTSPTGDQQANDALPAVLRLAEAAGKRPKSVGIVMDNTAAPVSFAKPMREGGLEKAGLKLVVDETFTPPLSDATSMIQKVRTARPDFIFLLSTNVPDDKLLVEKMAEFGLGKGRVPEITNGAHFGAPELLKLAGKDILEGTIVTVADWGFKGQEELIERFKQKKGEPWLTQDSLTTYGDMVIFKDALEAAGVADRRKVAEAIRKMDTDTGPAKYFPGGRVKFDEKGRRVGAVLLFVQWQNGEPVTVFPPEYARAQPIWPKS